MIATYYFATHTQKAAHVRRLGRRMTLASSRYHRCKAEGMDLAAAWWATAYYVLDRELCRVTGVYGWGRDVSQSP